MQGGLMADLWPVHISVWAGCLVLGLILGRVIAAHFHSLWAVMAIHIGLALSLTMGLMQMIDLLLRVDTLPGFGSWEATMLTLEQLYAADYYLRGSAHLRLLMQSAGIALVFWLSGAVIGTLTAREPADA